MFKKSLKFFLNFIILLSIIYFTLKIDNQYLALPYKLIIIITSISLLVFAYIFSKKQSISRLLYVIYILCFVVIVSFFILLKLNIISLFSSVSSLKEYILSTKEKGVLVYILIQIAQVVILPIPAAVICIVGSLIYGPLMGGIYCSIGVLIGSFISFYIGRTCGYRIVSWIVGKNNCDKYSSMILKRGSFFLSIAFLLPMFPDDILCLIAGITNMSLLSFSWVTILVRPIGVVCMSFFGSGQLIPFTGWGVYVWLVILVITTSFVFIIYKYQEPLQNFILGKFLNKSKTRESNK